MPAFWRSGELAAAARPTNHHHIGERVGGSDVIIIACIVYCLSLRVLDRGFFFFFFFFSRVACT